MKNKKVFLYWLDRFIKDFGLEYSVLLATGLIVAIIGFVINLLIIFN